MFWLKEFSIFVFLRCVTIPYRLLFYIINNSNSVKYETSARIEKIIYSCRLYTYPWIGDSSNYFATIPNKQSLHPRYVLDDHVILLSCDRSKATFIQLPEPITEYRSTKYQFTFEAFCKQPTHVITMPISSMIRLTEEELSVHETRKIKIVFAGTAGHTGSTLLSQMIQQCDQRSILSLNEPDFMDNIYRNFIGRGGIISLTKLNSHDRLIIKCAFRLAFKPLPGLKAYFCKIRPSVCGVVKLAKELMISDCPAFYMLRHDQTAILKSQARHFESVIGVTVSKVICMNILRHFYRYIPFEPIRKLIVIIASLARYDGDHLVSRASLENLGGSYWEFLAVAWADCMIHFVRCQNCFSSMIIDYDTLIKDPTSALTPIIEALGLGEQLNIQDLRKASQIALSVDGHSLAKRSITKKQRKPMVIRDKTSLDRLEKFYDATGIARIYREHYDK